MYDVDKNVYTISTHQSRSREINASKEEEKKSEVLAQKERNKKTHWFDVYLVTWLQCSWISLLFTFLFSFFAVFCFYLIFRICFDYGHSFWAYFNLLCVIFFSSSSLLSLASSWCVLYVCGMFFFRRLLYEAPSLLVCDCTVQLMNRFRLTVAT